jgi:hypothetical protein
LQITHQVHAPGLRYCRAHQLLPSSRAAGDVVPSAAEGGDAPPSAVEGCCGGGGGAEGGGSSAATPPCSCSCALCSSVTTMSSKLGRSDGSACQHLRMSCTGWTNQPTTAQQRSWKIARTQRAHLLHRFFSAPQLLGRAAFCLGDEVRHLGGRCVAVPRQMLRTERV